MDRNSLELIINNDKAIRALDRLLKDSGSLHLAATQVVKAEFDELPGQIRKLKEKNKEIYSRSVFLQGLIYKDPTELNQKLKPLSKYLERLKNIASDLKISLSQLALSYSLHNPFIDKVLIGVESEIQLLKNIQMANDDFQTDFDIIDRNINVQEEELLYPYNWN